MTTRRSIVKAGAGLAAIIAAGKAPAAFIRSALAARNGLMAGGGLMAKTPYIFANGASYINTGVASSNDMEVDISFLPLINHSYNDPIGTRKNTGLSECQLYSETGAGAGYMLRFGGATGYRMPCAFGPQGYLTFNRFNATATVCGREIQTVSYSGGELTEFFNIYIGALNGSNHSSQYFYGYLFFVNIRKSGETVLSMKPKVQNGVAGMWDSVTNQFFASATSTPFEYGEM